MSPADLQTELKRHENLCESFLFPAAMHKLHNAMHGYKTIHFLKVAL